MRILTAVIFDVDGVLVETEDLHRRAYNETFAELGYPVRWTPDDYARLLPQVGGRKIFTVFDRLNPGNDPEALAAHIYTLKTEKYRALVERLARAGKLHPRPGVIRLLKELRGCGLKMAAASTCEKQGVLALIRGALGDSGLAGFDAVCAGSDVKAKKPAPDIYLLALRRIGCRSDRAVAVEDSRHGLAAAHAAGLKCLVTPSEYTVGQDFNHADRWAPDLDGGAAGEPVTLETLERMLCAGYASSET